MHDQTTTTHGKMPLQHGDRSSQKEATLTSNIGALRPGKRSQLRKKPALTKVNGANLIKWLAAFCALDCVGASEFGASASLSPSLSPEPPLCRDKDPDFCKAQLTSNALKYRKCKGAIGAGAAHFFENCEFSCGYCPVLPPPSPPSSPPSPSGCTVPIDFVLVLDDSGSVGSSVEAMKSFAKTIVSGFDLGDDASRFAVVTFASGATLRTGLSSEPNTINNAIDQLTGSGWTSISGGLEMAQREFDLRARPATAC